MGIFRKFRFDLSKASMNREEEGPTDPSLFNKLKAFDRSSGEIRWP
jgi:hypothetical protein